MSPPVAVYTWTWSAEDEARFARLLADPLHSVVPADAMWLLAKVASALETFGRPPLHGTVEPKQVTTLVRYSRADFYRSQALEDGPPAIDVEPIRPQLNAAGERVRELESENRRLRGEASHLRTVLGDVVQALEKGLQRPSGLSMAVVNSDRMALINVAIRRARPLLPKRGEVVPGTDVGEARERAREAEVIDVEDQRAELGAGAPPRPRALPEGPR